MRQLLLLLAVLLLAPAPAAAQGPMACALNNTLQKLSVRIHLQPGGGQNITPAAWRSLLPMMEVCAPLQGAAAVRYEVTMSSVVPGAAQHIPCAVTLTQPSGRALMVVHGGQGQPLQCDIR